VLKRRFRKLKQGPFNDGETLRRYIVKSIKESYVPMSQAHASRAGIRGGGWTSHSYGARINRNRSGGTPKNYRVYIQHGTGQRTPEQQAKVLKNAKEDFIREQQG